MVADPKIWQSAQRMIERYGETALHQVENRIAELDAHGRLNTLECWREIHKAVQVLQQTGSKTPQ